MTLDKDQFSFGTIIIYFWDKTCQEISKVI